MIRIIPAVHATGCFLKRAGNTAVSVGLLLAIMVETAPAAETKPAACYAFDEGQGRLLQDSSGNGNHGTIHGAAWVTCGSRFALSFDGVDDYLDCGAGASLNLSRAVTVEAWVCPAAIPGAGEAGVLGKCYGSFFLTQYTDGNFWWYIGGGGSSIRAPVSPGRWHHVAGTFDGKTSRLYVDGTPRGSKTFESRSIPEGGSFFLGTSSGDSHYTKGYFYKGMIAEVAVHERALSAEEIAGHYRTTRLTGEIAVRPYVYPTAKTIVAGFDLRALGELPADATLSMELLPAGGGSPLVESRVSQLSTRHENEITLKVPDLTPGRYRLLTEATGADGRRIGLVSQTEIVWPEPPVWKDAPDAKVLNNLVAELLGVESPGTESPTQFTFTCPRRGWVFVSSRVGGDANVPIRVAIGDETIHTHAKPGVLESMRLLPKGEHRLALSAAEGLESLVVRAIPELIFAKFGPEIVLARTRARAKLHPNEAATYDWDFLSKHVLPNINVLIGTGGADQEPRLKEWKKQGKRWMVECPAIGFITKDPVTTDGVQKYLAQHAGFTNPLIDGVIVDEFGGSENEAYAAWTEAVERIRADRRFADKLIYPYCAPMHGAKASSRFIRTVMDSEWCFAFERYLPEQRGEAACRAFLDAMLPGAIDNWRQGIPGSGERMIVCMGTFSQPPESLDVNPAVDYKVYLDQQLNLLANDRRCFGLYGVMTYLSTYTGPEIVRWMGRLFRHYCIEGHTEPYTDDPLVPVHLENGDFETGLDGWQVDAAEPGAVDGRTRQGFSWLQGRYPMTSQGDTVLWMKRNPQRANLVRQKIKGLKAGRLYTLRICSGDYQDLSIRQELAISVKLDGAEVLPNRAKQDVFPNCYSHHHGPFNRDNLAWMNYHWIPFRAKSKEATLRISDWADPKNPGGPAGQEMMLNFVQVQPFYE